MSLTVATWNVNSIQVRTQRVLDFLGRWEPQVLLLQETKSETDKFPYDALEQAGYRTHHIGQKSYNGVAICVSNDLDSRQISLVDDSDDKTAILTDQARMIAADLGNYIVVSVYVPNGQDVGSEKYHYKMKWLKQLRKVLKPLLDGKKPVIVGGDFNIALTDEDVYSPETMRGELLFSEPEKKEMRRILDLGFQDCFRQLNPEGRFYTWWDYRNLGFDRDYGLRIDYILANHGEEISCRKAWVDRDERHELPGSKPSDHAPVLATFD